MSNSEIETRKHIQQVNEYMNIFVCELLKRAVSHDKTKLEEPEASIFETYTPLLKNSTYGSEEYKQFLSDMKVALDHHYSHNSHHPEHYKEQIKGMNLFDIVEMFCDWLAATKRHADGDIHRSIEINRKRFKMDDQIVEILKNTVETLENIEKKI